MRIAGLVVLLVALSSCSRKTPPSEFGKLAEEAVYKMLSFSPVGASGQEVGTAEGAGAVFILYGSGSGLQTGDGGPATQYIVQGSDGVQDQPERWRGRRAYCSVIHAFASGRRS